MDRIRRYAFVAAFFAVTALPVLCGTLGIQLVEPVQENRRLASPPGWAGATRVSKTIEQAMKWFDDHFGLRSLLIRVKNQIDYSVFHTSGRVYVGRDGWIIRKGIIDSEEPAIERMTVQAMDAVEQMLVRVRDVLARRNVRLVVVTAQMAYKFYPEGLPRSVAFAAKWRRFDDFRARLENLPGVIYVDTTKLLMPLRSQYRLYQRTDFHWSNTGAFFAAKALVDAIAAAEGEPRLGWTAPLRAAPRRYAGWDARFMPIFFPVQEVGHFFEDPPAGASSLVRKRDVAPFDLITNTAAGSPRLLPPLVVLGDSFFDPMLEAGLPNHFDAVYRARLQSVKLETVLRSLPEGTRYFVLEFIDLLLPRLPPEIELGKEFDPA
jgi:alginate O-acetyltransferase complex protein AlgJ